MTGWALLIPELLVVVATFWALFAERLPGGDRGAAWVGAALTAAAGLLTVIQPIDVTGPFGDLLAFDGPARASRVAIAALASIWLLWTAGRAEGRVREGVALALMSVLGGLLMSGARELITLFLTLELATLPAYVLIGYEREDVRSLEGALKYFLLSVLTSLVMLYGFSFLYGLTGTTSYGSLNLSGSGTLGLLAVLFVLVGMLAKLTAAPFHYWAPDAYAGASPWAVAFVATVPKVAGAFAMLRIVEAVAPGVAATGTVIAIVSAASMLLGSLAALGQTDLRRLMAYSGVARTGYLLLGVAAMSHAGFAAALFYTVAYALPGMAILLVAGEEGSSVGDLAGLSQRRPATAWGLMVLLLSLVGVPPLVGFFGKLYLFTVAIEGGYLLLVVIAVTMTAVSVGYYWPLVRAMFFATPPTEHPGIPRSPAASIAVGLCVFGTIALGVYSGPIFAVLGAFQH
jgi:NADH-quinone oxidoreductase subunit N